MRMQYDARGKLRQVSLPNAPASVHTNWYSGLGNLVATEWDNVAGNGVSREEMVVDPLGNIREKRTPLSPENIYPHDYHFAYTVEDLTGRVLGITRTDTLPMPWTDSLVFAFDTATRSYDLSGNMTESRQSIKEGDNIHDIVVRNYYSSDERLYATQKVDNALAGTNGVWEEYRYDPLGRRILVRAVKEDLCEGSTFGGGQSFCQSTITRYVWSGDQVLWEMRVAGEDTADLEKTAWSSGAPNAIRFGRVSYLHAGGIDRPLAITKDGVGTIVPHQNWRGMFAWGTWATGANKGLRSDCTTGNQTGCMSLAWPGWQTSAWHEDGNPGENEYWMGSLVDGMRDASGQIYMRNRYYDPATGQFTQTDPIGLAGGLNAYGFAAGDPVSYSDPYGLDPCSLWPWSKNRCTLRDFRENVSAFWRRLRDEPEQVQVGLDMAPHLFSAMASGITAGPIGRSVTVNVPGPVNSAYGKVDYLLGNVPNNAASAGKGGFFRGVLGFNEQTMAPALQRHLVEHAETASKTASGNINVTGTMVGANGRAANVTTAWRLSEDGKTLNFVTATPAAR